MALPLNVSPASSGANQRVDTSPPHCYHPQSSTVPFNSAFSNSYSRGVSTITSASLGTCTDWFSGFSAEELTIELRERGLDGEIKPALAARLTLWEMGLTTASDYDDLVERCSTLWTSNIQSLHNLLRCNNVTPTGSMPHVIMQILRAERAEKKPLHPVANGIER
jgi:hypothetical protein